MNRPSTNNLVEAIYGSPGPKCPLYNYYITVTWVFYKNLKKAILRPLLKKSNLDLTFKNYCPVSNLCYISKIVEKAVCNQITRFVAQTNNTEELQSAYRKDHSTETALLKVKTDLLTALDNQEVSYLILLDLSAAFNTVSHKLL